jgi:hypothetical protein
MSNYFNNVRGKLALYRGFRLSSLFGFSLLLVSLLLMPSFIPLGQAFAQSTNDQQWWFDVEFIAFKRSLEPSNNEDFSQADFAMTQTRAIDLLSLLVLKEKAALQPYIDLVPSCTTNQNPSVPLLASEAASTKDSSSMLDLSPLIPLAQNTETGETLAPKPQQVLLPHVYQFEKAPESSMRITCLLPDEELPLLADNNKLLHSLSGIDTVSLTTNQQASPIPEKIFSNRTYFNGHHHILPATETDLAELSKDVFRQRGIEPLLYTAWRQQVVFGENAASYYQIRAGEKFQLKSEPDNQPSEALLKKLALLNADKVNSSSEHDNKTFFADLEIALAAGEQVDWLADKNIVEEIDDKPKDEQSEWELDGLFKVYLDYVNQVPYLHIDSEFKHYKLNINELGEAELAVYPFKQRRRIISKQIHYFDHPGFGIIVRLERFTPPTPIIDETVEASE